MYWQGPCDRLCNNSCKAVLKSVNCPYGSPISAIWGPRLSMISFGRLKARVQIHGAENGLQGIHKQRLLLSAAGLLFSLAQVKIPPKIQLLRVLYKVRGADEEAFQLGELAFCKSRILPAKRIAHDKAKNRISEKLQLFVVFPGPLFVSVRAVGQGALEQGRYPKAIAQRGLKLLQGLLLLTFTSERLRQIALGGSLSVSCIVAGLDRLAIVLEGRGAIAFEIQDVP